MSTKTVDKIFTQMYIYLMDSLNYVPIDYNKPNSKKSFKIAILALLAVTAVLGLVFLAIRFFNKDKSLTTPFSNIVSRESKDLVSNPITGELVERSTVTWLDQRPLGVMVNNHGDARPQSGLVDADIVYEIVAEGGITRFLAFFLGTTPDKIGPVRSTREYYLVLVKELGDAMLMHIGYSPQALEAIEIWPVRSLARGGAEFWRDEARMQEVAIEHTAYVDGKYLRDLGDQLGWGGVGVFTQYKFKNDSPETNPELLVSEISVDFWYKGDYSAVFKYDAENNAYLRFMGYDENDNPIPHLDNETGKQIEVKNLIVQFVAESSIAGDEKNRLEYQLVGSGDGIVFMDGKSIKVTWTKADRDSRTLFYDLNGNEIEFNRGKFWISIVPDRNMEQVVY